MLNFLIGVYLGGLLVSVMIMLDAGVTLRSLRNIWHAVSWPYPVVVDLYTVTKPYVLKGIALAKVVVGKIVSLVNKMRGK